MHSAATSIKSAICGLIRFYQLSISRHIPHSCRFHPSCSDYALEAIRRRGIIKGAPKTIWRILRCHPFSPGGYDPV